MEPVRISRECDVIQIPAGTTSRLSAGTDGFLVQALGDSFTLQIPSLGGLFRLSGSDADAIGKEIVTVARDTADAPSEEAVWAELRHVYDPEIPVNIVDLGLVYDLAIQPANSGVRVEVKMTLTAQGCGMGSVIAKDAETRILGLPGIESATVEVVWDPPWNPRMISAEGRKKLNID